MSRVVGNKAKGRISKRVFQENKANQIFRKNEHFVPPDTKIHIPVPPPILRLALLPYNRQNVVGASSY